MAKTSQNKIDYIKDYRKKNVKVLNIEINMNTETDIYEKLMSVPRKATYIKNLIREDLKKESLK